MTTAAATLLLAGLTAGPVHAATAAPPPVLPGTITRIDNRPNGAAPNLGAGGAMVSADGRYAVFVSTSNTLTSGDRNDHSSDVFLYDAQTGKTTLVSRTADGKAANNVSNYATISSNGRYIAYTTEATDLPGADSTTGDIIYRYNIATGQNQLVTTLPRDTQKTQYAVGQISATGRFVAFTTASQMLPADTNDDADVYLWDANTGGLTLVSSATTGGSADGSSYAADVSADGHVAFVSDADDLSPGPNPRPGVDQVYLWSPSTHRISMPSRAMPASTGYVEQPVLSDNARYVTFNSITFGADGDADAHLESYDASSGRLSEIIDSGQGYTSGAGSLSMSATGRYVLIVVTNDLATSDPSYRTRLDIYDRATKTLATVTERTDILGGSISGDGRHVTLSSTATDLVTAPDTNGTWDAFLWTAS